MATRKKSPSRRAPAAPDASRKTNGSTGQKTESKRGRVDSKRGRDSEESPRRESSKRPASRGLSSDKTTDRRSDSRGARNGKSSRGDSRRIGSNGIRPDNGLPCKTPDMVDAEADKMKMYVAGAAGGVLILVVLLLLAVSGGSTPGKNPYETDAQGNKKSDYRPPSDPLTQKSSYDWTKDPDNIQEFEVPAGREESLAMSKELEGRKLFKRSAKCLYHHADFVARDAEACAEGKERQAELYDEAVALLERAAEIADKGDHGKDLADSIRRKSARVNGKRYAIFKHGSLDLDKMRQEEEAKNK